MKSKNWKLPWTIAIVSMMFCMWFGVPTLAEDAAPAAPVATAPAVTAPVVTAPAVTAPQDRPWWDIVWQGAIAIGAMGIAWGFKKLAALHTDNANYQKAIEAIRLGVVQTYNDEVVELKKSLGDNGSIDATEAARLRDIAIKNAKDIAVGPAKDVLIAMGEDALHALVQRVVNKEKSGGG